MKKKIFIFLLILSLSLVGCKSGGDIEEKDTVKEATSEKVLVYISGPEEMINSLEKDFEKERGDIADFLIMSCGEVRSKVWTEKESGKIQADVVLGSDPLIYNKLDNEDLLQNISSLENAKFISEEYSSENHNYLFVNERYVTILYNENLLNGDELPKSYLDLINKDYDGKLVIADPTQSSTALGIGVSLYQLEGIEYFEKLKENNLFLTKSNGQVQSLVLEGQYNLGIGPHDSVVRIRNKGKKEGYETPVKIIWPKEGAIVLRRPIAIIKDKERTEEVQKNAEELVNYFLSKEGQEITEKFGFVSVRDDIVNKYLPEEVNKINIDWDAASEKEDEFKGLYNEIFQN